MADPTPTTEPTALGPAGGGPGDLAREAGSADPRRPLSKIHGAHETPTPLANFLAGRVLRVLEPPPDGRSLTLLDPACGGGNLLAALAATSPTPLRRRLVLAGCERDPDALDRARAALDGLDVRAVHLRHADFLDAGRLDPALATVDGIVANPPYVRTQVLGASRSRELARRFGLSGRVDLYQVFLRAITDTLRPGGVLGLIASNRFLSVRAGADVRRLLGSAFDLIDLIDLGDTRLFPRAAVLPAIVVARRRDGSARPQGPLPPCPFVRVYARRPEADVPQHRSRASRGLGEGIDGLLAALDGEAEGLVPIDGDTVRIERGTLAAATDPAAPWVLTHPARDAWVARVEARASGTVGDVGRVRVGVKTTADAVFLRDDWDDLPPEVRPEAPLLRPALTHRDAVRWARRAGDAPRTRVLYPHAVGPDGRRAAIDLDAYPRARVYLERHRDRLEKRRYVIDAGRRWYEIWVPQDPAGWDAPKVVFPDIAEHPRGFLDVTGAIVNGDCYWITPADVTDMPRLLLALAVLNSSLATAYYDARYHNKLYAGRRRFITQYVAHFPLPDPSHPAALEVVSLVSRLTSGTLAPDETCSLDMTCDQLVWEAFGLDPVVGS